jgi:hypothetical protein
MGTNGLSPPPPTHMPVTFKRFCITSLQNKFNWLETRCRYKTLSDPQRALTIPYHYSLGEKVCPLPGFPCTHMHVRSYPRFISLINLSGLTKAHPYVVSCWHPLPASNHIARLDVAHQPRKLLLSSAHGVTGGPLSFSKDLYKLWPTKGRCIQGRDEPDARTISSRIIIERGTPLLHGATKAASLLPVTEQLHNEWVASIFRHCFLLLQKRRFNGHQFNWFILGKAKVESATLHLKFTKRTFYFQNLINYILTEEFMSYIKG